jgi:Predicted phosphatases
MTPHFSSPRAPAPKPRHIVWDWNGTLQDDVQAAVNGINLLLAERGLPLVDVETHRRLFDFPVKKYYEALGFELENEDWNAMANAFTAAFIGDESARLFAGTDEALRRVASAGIPMSLLSACEENALNGNLLRHGLLGRFAMVRGLGNKSAGTKFDIGRRLFADIGAPLDDVWMVGDTLHDCEVARDSGCQCLLLASGYQSRERLGAAGVPVLDGVADVPAFFGI